MDIKNIYRLILIGCLLLVGSEAQAKVAVLVSKNIKVYLETANAIQKYLPRQKVKIYTLQSNSERDIQKSIREIRSGSPKIIVAVGAKAAAEAVGVFQNVPVVHAMVINPEKVGLIGIKDVYGVHWSCSPKLLAETIKALLPSAKKIGVISSQSMVDLKDTVNEFTKLGLNLIISPINDKDGIPQSLRKLHQKIDVLWMGSERLLATRTNFGILKSYASNNKLPFIIPLRLSNGSGALAGITVTPDVAGYEASNLVRKLIEGKKIDESMSYADQIHLSIDLKNAQSLGIQVGQSALKNAADIRK